ncbi:MAG: UDP-N-acetylmuramoyl-L-alanyl-D-glutamate--2,6-diaminopimelate ligase [Spirochaetales bacterium]|nr:UDP-N-acetylmuramoyl-L-alanyl-D-glutamate--2,6-diaminopimelate ligase [Spirochaetales bacterium]
MAALHLSRLIDKYPLIARVGDDDPAIERIWYDSRNVTPGDLFVALPGYHVDGHAYIDDATTKGAAVVVCETLPEKVHDGVIYLHVAHSRTALSAFSARLARHPSRELPVIGVTGTDGKSTTTFLIDQFLSLLEEESGFISTALIKRDLRLEKNPFRQSTPEAPEIHAFLREMIENGKRFAVVEATSHGLSDQTSRLKDVDFHVAVFTNITHEHLEFHGSFEQYRSDKANLFRSLDRTASNKKDREFPIFGVVNRDDPNAYYFEHATRRPVLTYSVTDPEADLYAGDIQPDTAGTNCLVHWRRESREVRVPMPGPFNVENVLAAVLAVATLLDRNPLDLLAVVPHLKALPGRMQVISHDLPYVPIVDYAHTPGAFAKVLPLIKGYTAGRLIVVFGSAGERDVEKRAMQGELAARHGEVVILTDEDPRGEDRMAILEDIAAGCLAGDPRIRDEGRLFLVPDRRSAIRHALDIAADGDAILFLGKGHESSIIYADGPTAWDEAAIVAGEIESRMGNGASA